MAILEEHDPQGLQKADIYIRVSKDDPDGKITAAAPQQERIHPPIPVMLGRSAGTEISAPIPTMIAP